MREIEFLPAWYPQLRRRRRTVMLQAWVTVVILAGLGLWMIFASRNVAQKRDNRAGVAAQLDESRGRLKELNALLGEKEKLETQQRIMSKLGLHIEVTRLLAKLDEIMPKEMSLTEASFDTIEQMRTKQNDGRTGADQKETARKLVVKVSGVTPSDADWAGLLAKLSAVAFFQDVRLVAAQDKVSSDGHLMREFEVSFVVDLGSGG